MLRRAISTRPRPHDPDEVVRRWREANEEFEMNDHTGPASGPSWRIRRSRSLLVVTAVHGVRHTRPGRATKANDANTGGLALAIAGSTKASSGVVVRTSDEPDANSVTPHPFKTDLAATVQLGPEHTLVDLHGMSDHPAFDVALGLGPAPDARVHELAGRLADAFAAGGARVDLGGEATGLTARGPGTMTAWAQSLGVAAIQVEIAKSWRTFHGPTQRRCAVVSALLAALS